MIAKRWKRCSFDENNNFYATGEIRIYVTRTIVETTNSDYPVGSVS